ncbi:hypothetical protein AB1Y20_010347 [Prymnesium parvum]|uniref:Uncharacterized protein n=1 Tax=Prymnesium parvum TaxID=97485 RepID=A0AB34K6J4_PRYPA
MAIDPLVNLSFPPCTPLLPAVHTSPSRRALLSFPLCTPLRPAVHTSPSRHIHLSFPPHTPLLPATYTSPSRHIHLSFPPHTPLLPAHIHLSFPSRSPLLPAMHTRHPWMNNHCFAQVRNLYKRLLVVGRDYPLGLSVVREKAKKAFLANSHLEVGSFEWKKAIAYGRYMVKEMIGVIQLRKYRAIKQRYKET